MSPSRKGIILAILQLAIVVSLAAARLGADGGL